MIKEITVVICDACGAVTQAKYYGNQRDSCYTRPNDWSSSKNNSNVHFCPECTKKLYEKKEEIVR